MPRRAHAAPRSRRSSTSRSTRSARVDRDPGGRRRPTRSAGAAPDPDALARVAALVATSERPVLVVGRRRLLGARGSADARVRGSGARTGVRERHGSRHAARRSRARVLAGAFGRVEGSRSRARRGNAARLPARLRPFRRRARRAPVRRRERDRAARRARGVDGRRSRRAVRRARGGGRAARTRTTTGSRVCVPTSRRSARPSCRRSRPTPSPIKPARIYGELRKRLDRDAIVIGDGGDFVSYAGKLVESFEPGHVPRPRSVRLPGHGSGVRARGGRRAPRSSGRAAARRRRDRFRARRFRVAGAPRRERDRDRRQQRHLGTREASDAGAVRLRRRRRALARASVTTR